MRSELIKQKEILQPCNCGAGVTWSSDSPHNFMPGVTYKFSFDFSFFLANANVSKDCCLGSGLQQEF